MNELKGRSLKIAGCDLSFVDVPEHISFNIYLKGCVDRPCKKVCHNPELQDYFSGESMEPLLVIRTILKRKRLGLIDCICVGGGEPLSQDIDNLRFFIHDLVMITKLPVCLYTSYDFEEVPLDIKELITYVKCGIFNPELKTGKLFPASLNQKLYIKKENTWSES